MPRRTIILFAIFGALGIIGLFFMLAYNGIMGARLQAYVLQIRRCPYLSEVLCDQHPRCQPYYETSAADSNRPEFTACRPQSEATVVAEPACGKTGGTWRREKFGDFCDCSPVGKKFVPGQGCQAYGAPAGG